MVPIAAVGRWWRTARPRRQDLRPDTLAGLTGAVASVPDGMASSVLAGVNPVYGLYASFAGPAAGGLTTSTRFMIITTTSASALAAGSAIEGVDSADRVDALFLLVILAGVTMALAGRAGLGRYTRFVSHSVMIGFLTGIAVNIIAGQAPDFTGADASGSVSLPRRSTSSPIRRASTPASLAVGAGALALLVVAGRSRRLTMLGALIALVVPTVVVLITSAGVAQVEDAGDIPRGLPLPALPDLGLLSPG